MSIELAENIITHEFHHDRDIPLKPRHPARQPQMGINQVIGFSRDPTPYLENASKVIHYGLAAVDEEHVIIDAESTQSFRLRLNRRPVARIGIGWPEVGYDQNTKMMRGLGTSLRNAHGSQLQHARILTLIRLRCQGSGPAIATHIGSVHRSGFVVTASLPTSYTCVAQSCKVQPPACPSCGK